MPGSRNAQKANYEQVMYLTKITFEVHTNKYKESCGVFLYSVMLLIYWKS